MVKETKIKTSKDCDTCFESYDNKFFDIQMATIISY